MTREEAIMVLKNEQPHCGKKALFPEEKKYEAYNVAIKALEQEPCEDAISRQAAVNAVCDSECRINPRDCGLYPSRCFTVWGLEKLPSVIPSRPTGHCEDAISRQAVDEAIYDYSRSCDVNYAQIMEYIDKIPSVNPQDCDMCEVGNPCMYCKHEFEPQESEEI